TPHRLLEELGERAVQYGPAPGERLTVLDQVGDGYHLHAVVLQRDDVLLVVRHEPAALDPEHLALRGSVDVGVEDPDAEALGRQRGGQVGGNRRLADTALARTDGDYACHTGQRRLRRQPQRLS